MSKEGFSNFRIDAFKLGFPGKIIKTFFLKFKSPLEANNFGDSVIKEDEGFLVTICPDAAF